MLLPQFSIRTLIGATVVVAVMALIASWGGQGTAWAIGATVAVVMVVVTMLIHAALFGLMWVLSPLVNDWDQSAGGVQSSDIPLTIPAASKPPSAASEPKPKE